MSWREVVKVERGVRKAAWSWRVAVTPSGTPDRVRATVPLKPSPAKILTVRTSENPVFVPRIAWLGEMSMVNGV